MRNGRQQTADPDLRRCISIKFYLDDSIRAAERGTERQTAAAVMSRKPVSDDRLLPSNTRRQWHTLPASVEW